MTETFTITVNDSEAPVISGMPIDQLLNSQPNVCGAVAVWAEPTAADNCSLDTFSSDFSSGFEFPVGQTTVTYTALDEKGNTHTESFIIEVVDVEFPVITFDSDTIRVGNTSGLCSANVSWPVPTITDNCEVDPYSEDHTSGDLFDVGTHTVVFAVDDVNGLTTIANLTIIVEDNESPELVNLPVDIEVSNDLGQCGAVVGWVLPTASDNCPLGQVPFSDVSSNTFFSVGDTEVTYTIIDNSGNETTGSFTVTVNDTEAPVILTSVNNINQVNDPGNCGAIVTWSDPVVGDNCTVGTIESDYLSGATFPVGSTTVTYTITDIHGNPLIVEFTIEVTISDSEFPVISGMPADIDLPNTTGECGRMVNWLEPTVDDNCLLVSMLGDHAPGETFPVGVTVVTYTADDGNGNEITESFNITIRDTEFPVITDLPSFTSNIPNDNGMCGAEVSWLEPSVSDNCLAPLTITSDFNSGDYFAIGPHTVEYTVVDGAGNATTESFTFTIVDTEKPTITFPDGNIEAEANEGECGTMVTWIDPVINDNCDFSIVSVSHTSGANFVVGDHTVLYLITDLAGNTTEDSFTITINDTQLPKITGIPLGQVLNSEINSCGAEAIWTEPTASDNCTLVSFTSNYSSGYEFPVGQTTVTYTATDDSGNTYEENFIIEVIDVEFPVITFVSDTITVGNDIGNCSANVFWPAPTITDNCGVDPYSEDHTSGDLFNVGTHAVVFAVDDVNGLTTIANLTIIVEDIQDPELVNMPSDITVNNDPGICEAQVIWIDPIASDNCSIDTIVQSASSGDSFPEGESIVTYTVTDIHGNQVTKSFTITVNDNEEPQVVCQGDISTDFDQNCEFVILDYTGDLVTLSDNCTNAENIILTQTPAEGTIITESTLITIEARDESGNTSSCTFNVNPADNTAPVATCISVLEVHLDETGVASILEEETDLGSDDNCTADLTYSLDRTNFSCSDLLNNVIVTLRVTDDMSNFSTCQTEIIILDTINPIITGLPAVINIDALTDTCGIEVDWLSPSVFDNCSVFTITNTEEPGEFYSTGNHEVIYEAIDPSGNVTSHSFMINVIDNTPPVIIVTDTLWAYSAPYEVFNEFACGITFEDVENHEDLEIKDNCGIQSIVMGDGNEYLPNSDYEIEFTVTDINNNISVQEFILAVRDTIAPVPEGVHAGTVEYYIEEFTCDRIGPALQYVDNCTTPEDLVITANPTVESLTPGVETLVEWTIEDGNGNVSTFSQLLTVIDLFAPEVLCQFNLETDIESDCTADITDLVNHVQIEGQCNEELDIDIIVTDYLGNTIIDFTDVYYQSPDENYFIVDYIVSDASDTTTCQTLITIYDATAPVITNCPNDTTMVLTEDCTFLLDDFRDQLIIEDCSGISDVFYSLSSTVNEDSFDQNWTIDSPYDIEIVAKDASSDIIGNQNSAFCNFSVTFIDLTPPRIDLSMLGDTVREEKLGNCEVEILDYSEIVDFDDTCGEVIFTQMPEPGTYQVGDYESFNQIVFTAVDESNNSRIDSIPLIMEDLTNPTGANPASYELYLGSYFNMGEVFYTCSSLIDDTYLNGIINQGNVLVQADNCTSVENLSVTFLGDMFVEIVGVDTLSFEIIDEAGNASIVPLNIVVNDETAPYWVDETQIPDDLTVFTSEANGSECGYNFDFPLPLAADPCDHEVTVTASCDPEIENDFFPSGDYIITYEASDIYGNSIDTSFVLSVIDDTAPVIIDCPTVNFEFCSQEIFIPEIQAVDCEGDVFLVQSEDDPIQDDELFTEPGSYALTYIAMDQYGNSDECIVNVNITEALIAEILLDDTDLCVNEGALNFTDIDGQSSEGGTFWLFSDFNGTDYENVEAAEQLNPADLGSGQYKIKYQRDSSDEDCFVSDSIDVVVYDLPVINLPDLEDRCGLDIELLIPQNAEISFNWSTTNEDIPSNENTAMLSLEQTEEVTLILSGRYIDDNIGCFASDSASITLFEQPTVDAGAGFILDFTTSAELVATKTGEGEVLWESEDTNVSFEDETLLETEVYDLTLGENMFKVTVTNEVCEPVSDEIIITVEGFIIPSAYTPNGDGVNDVFEIEGLNSFKDKNLTIMNRWGKPIYENNNYNNDWDARNNAGAELPDDTYFYVLTLDEEVFSGYVIIKR